ncbi:hypothetical protein LCGC14_1068360 [marine sediment metagenome]|uniref:Uncharacterized protein n=1 Tax=marine sediment metagenome TaxID=412755 RepID=A0A0F9MNX9_9ZZZZ|nr:hypothetical protein [bacterium]
MNEEDKNPEKYQPVTDKAKAKAINFLINPENEQDRRVFANIAPQLAHLIPAIESIYDYIDQLLEAPLTINNYEEKEYEKLSDEEKNKISAPNIGFNLDNTLRNKEIRSYTEGILLLSVAQKGKRAEEVAEMIKNMNRPPFNPMAMMGGMFGNKSEDQVKDDNYPNELDG